MEAFAPKSEIAYPVSSQMLNGCRADSVRQAAHRVFERCEDLACCTDRSGQITRLFCSSAMRAAHDKVRRWMEATGLNCRVDPMGNLIGRWDGLSDKSIASTNRNVLLIGSHLDTVVDAGKYDGVLGVMLGLALTELLCEAKAILPFAVDVVGFCEEEGVRFDTPYIGSRALVGDVPEQLLELQDVNGVTLAEALRSFGSEPTRSHEAVYDSDRVIAYLEPHIEQGPVLEMQQLPIGIVNGVIGQSRASVEFVGRAGHAGTVPMSSRHDALVAASQFVVAVEHFARSQADLMATVGHLTVKPNVANVIPAQVKVRLDLRHSDDAVRKSAFQEIVRQGETIARRRELDFKVRWMQEESSVRFDSNLTHLMHQSALDAGVKRFELPSGAGHDAAIMARRFPTAMLFIRCQGGVSHHPDEKVLEEDVVVALDVLLRFALKLSAETQIPHSAIGRS